MGVGGCVNNRIRLDDVERLVARFLEAFDRRLDLDVEDRAAPHLERLRLARAERGLLLDALEAEMEAYVLERIPQAELEALRAGDLRVIEAYRHYHDREEGDRAAEIERLEDEIGDLAFKAADHAKVSVARRKFDERIASLEARVARLREQQVPLDRRLDAAHRELEEIRGMIRAAAAHASERRTRRAAEVLRGLLREIRVYSVENPLKGGTRPDRVTERVVFVPVLGTAMEFAAAPPPYASPPRTIERARELWREGKYLSQIGRQLTAEGLAPPRGKIWHHATLTRLLADEIAAGPARRDGRSCAPPHTPPAAKDA
jgi:hypothetical protein